jgi:hypothetical protein
LPAGVATPARASTTSAVGADSVTLNYAGFASLGILATLNGGTISAPNRVSLGVGALSPQAAHDGNVSHDYQPNPNLDSAAPSG